MRCFDLNTESPLPCDHCQFRVAERLVADHRPRNWPEDIYYVRLFLCMSCCEKYFKERIENDCDIGSARECGAE